MAIVPSSPELNEGHDWMVLVRAMGAHTHPDILSWFERHRCVLGYKLVDDPANRGRKAVLFRVLNRQYGFILRNEIEQHWSNG